MLKEVRVQFVQDSVNDLHSDAARIFFGGGRMMSVSGAEPQKIFLGYAQYFGYKCDQRPFYRLASR